MAKAKVVNFPAAPRIASDADVLWVLAVARTFKDSYSCEYNSKDKLWSIRVSASSIKGLETVMIRCRHDLGLDMPFNEKEAAR